MILVTGATGNIGRELIGQFVERGKRVRVLVRDERRAASLFGKVDPLIGDLDRIETLSPAMQGVEKLFLVTPDTKQVANLLEAAKLAGVKHVVKVSTIEADRSLGPGKWHRQQEELIKSNGFKWTFLRPTMMMVNTIEWWSETIKSQRAVYFPGGKGKLAPVDAKDVSIVASAVLTEPGHEGRIYELTGPESLTIGEMVEILAKVLNKPLRYVNVPTILAAVWLRKFGMSRELVQGLMETLGALRRNEYAYVTDCVQQVGGVTPRTFEHWCNENMGAFQ